MERSLLNGNREDSRNPANNRLEESGACDRSGALVASLMR
jgi:hypothetical protein